MGRMETALGVSWQNQIANAYAIGVAKYEQAALDNPALAKTYLKIAKNLQVTVDLYRREAAVQLPVNL